MTPNDRLISAAQRQDFIALLRALQDGSEVNARNSEGVTALMLACDQHWVEGVELLLERGADVHVFDNLGYAALGHAEYNGERLKHEYEVRRSRILALLRERGAPETRSQGR